jgi:hypothetical protein
LKKPFEGLDRDQFYSRVVHGGERPIPNRKWPEELVSLMTECWRYVHGALQYRWYRGTTLTVATVLIQRAVHPSVKSPSDWLPCCQRRMREALRKNSRLCGSFQALLTVTQPGSSKQSKLYGSSIAVLLSRNSRSASSFKPA